MIWILSWKESERKNSNVSAQDLTLYLNRVSVSFDISDSLNVPSCRLNHNIDMSLTSAGCSNKSLGIVVAMVTYLAFEKNPERKKINILKY